MALTFHRTLQPLSRLRHKVSAAFLLQSLAGAGVAWPVLQGGPTAAPADPTAGAASAGPIAPAGPMGAAGPMAGAASGTGTPARAAGAPLSSSPMRLAASPAQLASAPGLAEARLALSSIDVTVPGNDTLDRMFGRLKLNRADPASLRSLPGLRARLDSLRPGEALRFTHKDGLLFGLERRLNESETLKVSREPSGLKADVLQNALETRTRTVRGRIDHSLFEAVAAAGANDQIAVALADIFGWDIDFVLDVRSGDAFVVTYDEIWRDGAYLKDGPVQAAAFVNQGREFRAVRYTDPEGGSRYYTPDGRSLYRAFLRAPVDFTRVSSRFNSARRHPILNRIRAHQGVDYAAPMGTPVRAAGDGRIRFAGRKGGYGNLVEIEHTRSIVTVYGHLSRFAPGTRVGTQVTQGAVIAYVGMTGPATGPHLHYEYRVNGVFKNPQTVILPAAAPIDARWQADFLARSAPLLASLYPAPGPMLVSR